ncbi:MAG: helicase-associated domain-containing protein [Planctomycetes bacterium]|nr:helicase-associated domain-containing protein [Planctomycetota bacterium]
MKLEQALEHFDGKDLDHALGFWNFDRHAWPVGERDRRRMLGDALSSRRIIEERLPQLPSKLRDLLVFVVRSGRWSEVFDLKDFDAEELPVDDFELVPVATALAERGFFIPRRARGGASRGTSYCIPEELGRLLEIVFDSSRRPIDASLGLRAHLRFVDRGELKVRLESIGLGELREVSHVELYDQLIEARELRRRIDSIEIDELKAIFDEVEAHGGVLDDDARRRLGIEVEPEILKLWGRELERRLLGCYERCELTNHGLTCGDGWLVIFAEVVDVLLGAPEVDEDEAGSNLRRGCDAVADLRGIVASIERSPFKVKKTGEYYKTALRKLVKDALTPGERPAGEEADLLWYLDFLVHRDLITPALDHRLRPTRRWQEYRQQGGAEILADLLENAQRGSTRGMSALHHRGLRREFIELLKPAGTGVWLAVSGLVTRARNAWLAQMVRPEQAQRYQDRHKNAPFPPLATPDLLLRCLQRWVVEGLARVGVVDLSIREGERRPWALRLNVAGARAFGLKIEELHAPVGLALVVNPDHEVIVFPENAGPDLIHELGRFAVREKADFALHYRLTRESVQEAAAAGLDAEDILALLDEHSRHSLPENVAFSVREWCERLVRIEARRAWVLEAAGKADIDRLLEIAELRDFVLRRLDDRIVEVAGDPSEAGIANLLRDRGIQLV